MYGDFEPGDVRVAIVSADPLVRSALGGGLRAFGELRLVGELDSADVVIWDAGADPVEHPRAWDELERLALPVVALVADAALAARALAAGARAVVLRELPSAALVAAVIAVHRGLVVLDPAARAQLVREVAPEPALSDALEELTARELEVLEQLASGRSNKRIARALGISEHTAKFHVNSILAKLGASSRTEAVVAAARRGLVTL
jgi:two-component system, NarL family, nitrate/nitrite response regulator NarL